VFFTRQYLGFNLEKNGAAVSGEWGLFCGVQVQLCSVGMTALWVSKSKSALLALQLCLQSHYGAVQFATASAVCATGLCSSQQLQPYARQLGACIVFNTNMLRPATAQCGGRRLASSITTTQPCNLGNHASDTSAHAGLLPCFLFSIRRRLATSS
jgi:hypothetical protein